MNVGRLLCALAAICCACGGQPGLESSADGLHCTGPSTVLFRSAGGVAAYACPGPLGCSGETQPTCDFRDVADLTPCPDFAEGVSFTDALGTATCTAHLWRRSGTVSPSTP
jgi:hypothetical protein